MHPLAPADAQRFLRAAEGHRLEHLFAFMLGTGVRLGEALALRWSDVDLDTSRVQVRHTLERLAGQPWRLGDPKSEKSKRIVPLIGPSLAALRAQRAAVVTARLQLGAVWEDHDFVFPNAIGGPLDGTNVYHEFKKLLRAAALPTSYRVHDLRHSTATYLLAAGVPDRIVMEILGHSQLSMTMRYQHVLPAMLDEAAARLEAVFPSTKHSATKEAATDRQPRPVGRHQRRSALDAEGD